jgi:L-ascorbate metabolism protein UlaG (beta-lactamase superfamily)
MSRYLTILAAGLFAAGGAPAADAKKVTIRWHGQSFFEIESSAGTKVVTDPHAIEAFGRKSVTADLVLLSHFHNDHTQIGVLQKRGKQDLKILTGLKDVKKRLEWNIFEEKFRDVTVRTVGVYHDGSQGLERGKVAVFIIEVDGLRIVHLGDLGHLLTDLQVKNIGPVDVLMVPVGGVYTINGSEAKKVVAQLKPRQYVLPMHYGTEVYQDLLPADEFLDEQKKDVVKKMLNTNKLEVSADFKPKEPLIVLLGWSDSK